jgi:hypothetical protein
MPTHILLLEEVIADARIKWAKIEGWKRSENGRIVIQFEGQLPAYYFNAFSAVDTLIHQYKLISKYHYIYQSHSHGKMKDQFDTPDTESNDNVEKIAIISCDELLLNGNRELSLLIKHKLYQAIFVANSRKNLTHTKFFSIRAAITDHYQNLYDRSIAPPKERKRLRQIARFCEEMSYKDFTELL